MKLYNLRLAAKKNGMTEGEIGSVLENGKPVPDSEAIAGCLPPNYRIAWQKAKRCTGEGIIAFYWTLYDRRDKYLNTVYVTDATKNEKG